MYNTTGKRIIIKDIAGVKKDIAKEINSICSNFNWKEDLKVKDITLARIKRNANK